MYRSFAVAAALGIFVSLPGASFAQTKPATKPADKPAPKGNTGAAGLADPKFVTNDERVSYGVGLEIGGNVKLNLMQMAGPMFKNLKLEAVMWGIRDGLMEEGVSRVSETELTAAQTDFQSRLEKIVKELSDKNLKAATAFLAQNKAKPGVKSTKNGLQYKVVKSGKGATPKPTDIVRVHYHGTRTDGSVFDSSVDRKMPADIPVPELIPGWKEALSLMKVGDKWTLYVPPDLAYGEAGREGIEPNSLLVFDLELLEIVKPDELGTPTDTGEEPAARPATKAASGGATGGTNRKPATPR